MEGRKFYKVTEINIEDIKKDDRFLIRENNIILNKNGQIVFRASTDAKLNDQNEYGVNVKLHDSEMVEDMMGETTHYPIYMETDVLPEGMCPSNICDSIDGF